jgi:hypothetical protein
VIDHCMDNDVAAEFLERRWFAARSAAQGAQAECEVLAGVMWLAEDAWRQARARLAELENLQHALGDELATLDAPRPRRPNEPAALEAKSAAGLSDEFAGAVRTTEKWEPRRMSVAKGA